MVFVETVGKDRFRVVAMKVNAVQTLRRTKVGYPRFSGKSCTCKDQDLIRLTQFLSGVCQKFVQFDHLCLDYSINDQLRKHQGDPFKGAPDALLILPGKKGGAYF